MKTKHTVSLLSIVALVSACSPGAELDEAKARIARLEAELLAEKAKSSTKPILAATATPIIAPTLQAETTPLPGAQWTYTSSEDKMTGGTSYQARVISTNTVTFGPPYGGPQNGRLTLRTDPRNGKDVIFRIERGQLRCHSYDDCDVLVRFDDEKPERLAGVGPDDRNSQTVFIGNYEKFVTKLRKAKIVRISMSIYQQGAPVFEFDVSGFDHAQYVPRK